MQVIVIESAEDLVRVLEDGFYNASNEFSDLSIEKYRTEAAALIESYSRRVPRAMLQEIEYTSWSRGKDGNIDDINTDAIAAEYGVKVEG